MRSDTSQEREKQKRGLGTRAAPRTLQSSDWLNAGSGSQCGLMGTRVNSGPMPQEETAILALA